ncbi:hypothetical protein [Cohnella abietis]|uniref:DUF2157 domain-containing protein n=1 Tax=Cohnella abietis TaxID=2507935 RepID=A0A3T1D9J8_9BACL|nr:hypothetical protein [Cohnella abietis]BBI34715.1 hypothetical protein KCTCHS21_41140 [Cohnella abietis]
MAALDEEKRNLVVKEIESWRRSKLLPGKYCDFLENLYLDDLNERPKGFMETTIKKIGQASRKQWFLTFGIFTLICFVVLHFSAFPVSLQIGLTGAVTMAFIAYGGKQRHNNPLRGLLSLGIGMVFLIGAGFGIVQLNGWMGGIGPMLLLGFCSLVWIGIGILMRVPLLHWFGWMAVVVFYALLLARHVPNPSLFEVQVFWIPAALLFAWLSWYLHVRFKSVGAVFFASALVLWFMPEVYSALYGIQTNWIQIEILFKIVIAGVAMFRLRKQWMEWVA